MENNAAEIYNSKEKYKQDFNKHAQLLMVFTITNIIFFDSRLF
jgi:hypothetical protein